jgi:hypothetical protein
MSIFTNRMSDADREAGAYTKAVLGLLGDRDAFVVLESMPDELEAAVSGISDADLDRPEAPGKWSVRRIVRHHTDSEIVWAYRLRKIVAEDRPTLLGYDQDLWADRLHYDEEDLAAALEEFRVMRCSNLRLIRALGPEERRRVGVHRQRGDESVEHQIRLYAGHDILHLNQIARAKKALGLGE